MKVIFRLCFLLLVIGFASGCSVNFKNVGVASDGSAYANSLTSAQKESIAGLEAEIMTLNPSVDRREAASVAYNAVVYPMHLSNQYKLVWPPSLQNIFVNSGVRPRGLCYQWTSDMLTHLRKQHYRTLEFTWTIANRATPHEHNTAVVVAKGQSWREGVILDPWRNSGNLYWNKVVNDPKYKWSLFTPKKNAKY